MSLDDIDNFDHQGDDRIFVEPRAGDLVICDACHREYVWQAEYSAIPADANEAAVHQAFPTCPDCFRWLMDRFTGR